MPHQSFTSAHKGFAEEHFDGATIRFYSYSARPTEVLLAKQVIACQSKRIVVPWTGIEPVTYSLEESCSIR